MTNLKPASDMQDTNHDVEIKKDPEAPPIFCGVVPRQASLRKKRNNDTSPVTIREAVAYGNVMGSINVEGFGAESLLKASHEEIERRHAQIEQQSARA